MNGTVRLAPDYPFPAGRVRAVVATLDHLQKVTEGLWAFRHLLAGTIHHGQELDVEISLFGRMPCQPYRMTVQPLDTDTMTFQSEENRVREKARRHRSQATPLFVLWAKAMQRAGRKLRLSLPAAMTEGDTQ